MRPGTSWQHRDSLLVVWVARNSPDGLLHGGGSSMERLIGASPCKPVRCPARGSKSSVETRGNSGMGCQGRAMARGDRRRGGVLSGRSGSLGASMILCGGWCLRQCSMERTGVPEGDCNDAWSGGSTSRRRAVVAPVVIQEQCGKMGMEKGGRNEEGKTKPASTSRV
jgi:hypothetical protein